jgi:hypothetical protein
MIAQGTMDYPWLHQSHPLNNRPAGMHMIPVDVVLEPGDGLGQDPFDLFQPATFVLDTDIAVIPMLLDDDLHHLEVVGRLFVSGLVEVMRFGADCFGVRHQFIDPFVAVVVLVVPGINREVAKVRQGAAVG